MHGTPGTLPGRVHSPEDGSFLVQFACPHCEAPCRQVTLQLLPRQLPLAGLWRAAACRRHAETMRMHSAACVPRCWLLGSESFSACASLLGWSRGPGPWAQAMWVSRDARGHHQSESKPPTVLCGIGHWNCWLGLAERRGRLCSVGVGCPQGTHCGLQSRMGGGVCCPLRERKTAGSAGGPCGRRQEQSLVCGIALDGSPCPGGGLSRLCERHGWAG